MNGWNAVDGSLAMALETSRGYERPRRFTVVQGSLRQATAVKAAPMRSIYIAFSLTVLLVVSVLGLNAYKSYNAYRSLAQVPLVTISVKQGDSLWDIARTHGIEGVPITQLMEAIKEWNNMEVAQLNAGQELLVPQSL